MIKVFSFFLLASRLLCNAVVSADTSQLWGTNGELWQPGTSPLRDFSDVGYMNGNVPIPDWPVGVSVLDFGAVPDDDGDDSQAFIDAIAACPDNTAVYVPKGKYIILQQIRVNRNYFVLRGEDMYETVLFFPKNLAEIYPACDYDVSYGYQGGFFFVDGGTHRSIETLTFEFRKQTKMGFWEFRGANSIKYQGGVTDSWIRNIHHRNVDFGVEFGGAERVSVLNQYFSHYVGRQAFITSAFHNQQVGYLALGLGGANKCLFHNIQLGGNMFHDLDIINVPSYNVVSNVNGPNIGIEHHGRGANHNLYTEIYCGAGGYMGLEDSREVHHETHWGIHSSIGDLNGDPYNQASLSNHVFVGTDKADPTSITPTMFWESIDPDLLTPSNIYLAQMTYNQKPLPLGPPSNPPLFFEESTGDVRWLNPTDDLKPGASADAGSIPFDGYLKFDLSSMESLTTIEHVRLRICTQTRKAGTSFDLSVSEVHDDSWTETSFDTNTIPQSIGALLGSAFVDDDSIHRWFEFNVTSFVQSAYASDQVVSFYIGNNKPGNFLGTFHTSESGNAPQLVIEQVASPVPGPPEAPGGVRTISKTGHILLDWNNSTEADFAYYNVYRRTAGASPGHLIAQGLTLR